MKIVLGILLGLVVGFAGVTWLALEAGGGVAVVETRAADGSTRSTHVWFVEDGEELWLEAGTPENRWYQDVLREPVVSLVREGRIGRYVAEPTEDRERHRWLRGRLTQKYGWRDRWVSFYVDQERSLAVKLALRREAPAP